MTEVDIEYCVPCGLLEEAVRVQKDLLTEFGQELGAVTLTPGHGGVFKVRVNGKVVFDREEGTYDESELIETVRERV